MIQRETSLEDHEPEDRTGTESLRVTFKPVAEVGVGQNARIYEHGWQSWSPTDAHPASLTVSPRPCSEASNAVHYRGRPLPPSGFQADGLLALDPGDGQPVRIWWAPNPTWEVPSLRARVEKGVLEVAADGEVREALFSAGLWSALAAWADAYVKTFPEFTLRPLPAAWCTWYHYFTEIRQEDVVENLAAIDQLGLDIGVVQIDDGYQSAIGDWLELSPRFPRPLSELADRIRSTGRRAGIWTAPLLVAERSRHAAEHPDWLVRDGDAGRNWDQHLAALDVTHPDAAAHLQHVFRTLSQWGFDYFKLDFLYAGAIEGRRRQSASPVAAYREAMRLIRDAVGPNATLLGCGAPILPSIGLVDAMRISPDTGPRYEPKEGDLSRPGQRSAVMTGKARAFQHGRFWINDPDCLIARPEVERRDEWADHVDRFGGLRSSGDRLLSLDDWGLETTRRLLHKSGVEPFSFLAEDP